MDFNKDYYSILGVKKNAGREEIKAAYRSLAMRYHPDKNNGDQKAEEKFKEINEAHEVLTDNIKKQAYDDYRGEEERTNLQQTRTSGSKNSKTYVKKIIVRKEQKIYIKGEISIKYWSELEQERNLFVLQEIFYRLNPVSAEAVILKSDIHFSHPPKEFSKTYSSTELFKSGIPQPVKCEVRDGQQPGNFDLTLMDIRIVDPVLTHITKHENQSLGTLSGTFYAYVLKIVEEEKTEMVTEFFGETGRTEHKTENGEQYYRREYYHSDGSVFWAPWEHIIQPKPANRRGTTSARNVGIVSNDGCAILGWIPLIVIGIIAWPQFFAGIIVLGLLFFLLSLSANFIAKVAPFLLLMLIAVVVFAGLRSAKENKKAVRRTSYPTYDTLRTTRTPVSNDLDSSNTAINDTLISHYISWKDYDSNSYSIQLQVSVNDLKKSAVDHQNFQLTGFESTLAPVYSFLGANDKTRLKWVFNAFDSIREADSLDELAFANMVVSCIQSVPYYLVVDKSCNAGSYEDEFIYNYLKQCDRECCIGNERFGLRSPVEFVSDLKGDCDTRALLIYCILKHFDFEVALLASEYYRHAVVAVAFDDERDVSGLSMDVNNRNYYLWETTNKGFKPGEVPPDVQDISRWDIVLLNEKSKKDL